MVTVVVAVPVAESSSVAVNVMASSPGAAVASTASVPPAAPVDVNVTPDGSDAGLVTAREVTAPSASVALTVADAAVPCGVVSVAGAVTTGGWFVAPHGATALLSGSGAAAVKSTELSSVSTAPPPLRTAAVVLDSAGAAAVSDTLAVP